MGGSIGWTKKKSEEGGRRTISRDGSSLVEMGSGLIDLNVGYERSRDLNVGYERSRMAEMVARFKGMVGATSCNISFTYSYPEQS